MTVGEALAHGTSVLAEAGIDTARLEAELLLAKACDDCARALLYMELRRELSPEDLLQGRADLRGPDVLEAIHEQARLGGLFRGALLGLRYGSRRPRIIDEQLHESAFLDDLNRAVG